MWGKQHKKDSAEECCQACSDYKPVPEMDNMDCTGGRERVDGGRQRENWTKREAVGLVPCVTLAPLAAQRG